MKSTPGRPVADDPLYGWWSSRGAPQLMAAAHRHNELELNLVQSGEIVYLFPGKRVELYAGHVFFFWSAVPHQMIQASPDAYLHWLTIPLTWLVQRGIPEQLTRPLLEGSPLQQILPPEELSAELPAFQRWHAYLQNEDTAERAILMLEVEARLRRLVLELALDGQGQAAGAFKTPVGKADQLAHYLADHFTEESAVKDATRAAALHPNYAMALFRRAYGLSMVSYVTQLRVAQAQQLLVNSDQEILQIGMDSGFGSNSRFYAAFKALTGQSPHAYRAALRWREVRPKPTR